MNQYTFNLDQNYLQHDKFGAHYSKNKLKNIKL